MLRDDLDALHAIMHEEDLPAAIDLAQNSLAYHGVVVLANRRANGQAFLRRRFNDAHIAQVDERHMQCARNRCRGHRQNIDLGAQLLEPLFMRDAEALLFVHDQ